MLGFKSLETTAITFSARIDPDNVRQQPRFAFNPNPSLAEQFAILAAQATVQQRQMLVSQKFPTEPR